MQRPIFHEPSGRRRCCTLSTPFVTPVAVPLTAFAFVHVADIRRKEA